MKIVQTYWSKAYHDQNADVSGMGGWILAKFHLISWSLSCLLLRELYNNVELVTDQFGKELLIGGLKLPYTSIRTDLDAFDSANPRLWALGKVFCYSLQNEPFLHIDGDVFIWKRFGNELETVPLVAQNFEFDFPYYSKILNEIDTFFDYIPTSYLEERKNDHIVRMVNTGIIGGSNLDFYKMLTKEAFSFIEKNEASLNKIDINSFNLIYDQYLLYCLASKENISICYFLESVEEDYYSIANFNGVPKLKSFVHILGPYKKYLENGKQMELYLKNSFPEFHKRVIKLSNELTK